MFSFLNKSSSSASSASASSCSVAYPTIKETIPPSHLGYNTNNRFPEFPPMMSDGRALISSWQPEAIVNDRIIKDNNIKSNWQYRKFIKQHANEILEYNLKEVCNDTGYFIKNDDQKIDNIRTGEPYLYKSVDDNTRVLGLENNSDLKELYLSRERLDARKIAPSMTQAELIQTYGINPTKYG
jgi:hypothetical protein